MRYATRIGALLLACAACASPRAHAEWIADAEAAYLFDSNVSRGERASDERSDSAFLLRATGGYYFQLGDRTGLTLAASAAREEHLRYSGLSYVGIGPTASVRTKLGLGPQAPWIRLSASAQRREFDNDVRTGWLFTAALAAGVRIGERIDLRAETRLERSLADRSKPLVRAVSGAAYDLDGATFSLSGDYMISRDTLVSAGYAFRRGDVVSSTRRNRDVYVVSEAIAADPAFGPDIVAYRIDARSHVFDLRVSHALGNDMSINAGIGRSLTYGKGDNDYYSTTLTVSVLYNF